MVQHVTWRMAFVSLAFSPSVSMARKCTLLDLTIKRAHARNICLSTFQRLATSTTSAVRPFSLKEWFAAWLARESTLLRRQPDHHATDGKDAVDLIYLDPPFNSKKDYNLLYRNMTGKPVPEQVEAFCDTWERWTPTKRTSRARCPYL
jgi:16S rRNA G966 N2-methylase RsmD